MSGMVATNGNFFDMDDRSTVYGDAVSNGASVNPPTPVNGSPWALLASQTNEALIWNFGSASPPGMQVWTAVAGNIQLLDNGQNVAPPPGSRTDFSPFIAARTAVGLAPAAGQNPPYLFLLTVDGVESDCITYPYGATHFATAQWLLAAGATDGISLDGGGSTAMARIDQPNAPMLMNVPHGDDITAGNERSVGNCFCVIATL
jgi:hypothetical protein